MSTPLGDEIDRLTKENKELRERNRTLESRLFFRDGKPDERTDRAISTQPGDQDVFGRPLRPGS